MMPNEAVASRAVSLRQLRNALPELQQKEIALATAAAQKGIYYRIANYGGVRTQADTSAILRYRIQDYAAAIKRDPNVAKIPINRFRRIAPWTLSYHDYGAAFDAEVIAYPSGLTHSQAVTELALLAPSIGLVNGASFGDIAHYELPGALAYWRARFGLLQAKVTPTGTAAALAVVLVILLAVRMSKGN